MISNKNLAIIVGLTLVSGVMSGCLLFLPPLGPNGSIGLYFGVATALIFRVLFQTPTKQLLLWILASIASWYCALQVYLNLSGTLDDAQTTTTGSSEFWLAGLVGGLVLGLALYLVKQGNPLKLVLTTVAGAVLGETMSFVLSSSDGAEIGSPPLIAAFCIWQVGMGLLFVLPIKTLGRKVQTVKHR